MLLPPQALTHLKASSILTAPQVAARLMPIPGFIVVNAQGQALTATPKEGKPTPTIGIFLRQKSAALFLEELQRREPGATGLRVKAVSIGELYTNAEKPGSNVALGFIPDPAEVEQAKKLLEKQGKPAAPQGVPLFAAELPGKGLLNVTQNGKTFVPVFFSLADLIPMVENYNKNRPSGVPEAQITVASLEFFLQRWCSSLSPGIGQVRLMVNKGILDEARALAGGS